MKKNLFLFALFFGFQILTAQYTEIINSKRPGFSESPYGVGTKVFQVEAGAFYHKRAYNQLFDTSKSFGSSLFLRYGIFSEKLEFNLDFAYQQDERVFYNVIPSYFYNVNGISKLRFGVKYLIHNQKYTDKSKEVRSWKKRTAFDMKRLIPSVGVYVGVNPNFIGKDFKEDGVSLKGAVLLQNDISSRFVILTNLIADKILLKNKTEFGYILTATYAVSTKWSIFGENQGVFSKYKDNEFQFGAGTAYLLNNNVQFDISARSDFFADKTNYYLSLGGSWRLDRHRKTKKSEDVLKGEKQG
ncbi:MAG TPA: transporter, partial [Flavobacteriia bacterium]|nr:transporter [Flavobacteriia bacterium]